MLQHACAGCRRPVITRRLLTPCVPPISGDSGQFGSLRLAISVIQTIYIVQWQQVASSHVQWQQVAFGGNRCLLVAVRSHTPGSRINPDIPTELIYLTRSVEEQIK
jgi:hypothetical protein